MNISLVFVPVRSIELGASGAVLGAIVAAFPVAGMLLSYPSGALADLFGRPTMLLVSAVTLLVAAGCYLFAGSLLPLAVGHLLLGLFDVLFWISAITYVSDLAAPGQEAVAQSIASACLGAGAILGVGLAGLITVRADVQVVFVLLLILAGLALSLVMMMAARHMVAVDWRAVWPMLRASYGQGVGQLIHNGGVRQACLLYVAGSWGWYNLGRSFYVAYLQTLAVAASGVGMLAMARGVSSVVGRLAFPALSRRIGRRATVIGGIIVGALSLAVTPLLSSLLFLALVGCLGETMEMLKDPGTVLGVTSATRAQERALGISNINATWALSAVSGSLVYGIIAERVSLAATFFFGPALIVASVIAITVLGRKETKGQPAISSVTSDVSPRQVASGPAAKDCP